MDVNTALLPLYWAALSPEGSLGPNTVEKHLEQPSSVVFRPPQQGAAIRTGPRDRVVVVGVQG